MWLLNSATGFGDVVKDPRPWGRKGPTDTDHGRLYWSNPNIYSKNLGGGYKQSIGGEKEIRNRGWSEDRGGGAGAGYGLVPEISYGRSGTAGALVTALVWPASDNKYTFH